MRRRIRHLVTVLTATAALVLPTAATSVATPASERPHLVAELFSGPANLDWTATTAGLKAGRPLAALGLTARGTSAAPTLASETKESQAHARDGSTGPRASSHVTNAPFDPTAEPAELTLADCASGAAAGPVYAPDRFDICETAVLGARELEEPGDIVQGVAEFTDTLIGGAGFGDQADRALAFQEYISNVSAFPVGPAWNPAIFFDSESFCTAVLGSGACRSRTDFHVGLLTDWLANGGDSWQFALTVPPGGGVGRDDIIKEVLNEGFNVVFPPPFDARNPIVKMPDLNVRWDDASYVKNGYGGDGAAIFDYIPPLIYNMHGQGTDEVAAHIADALLYPDQTVPAEPPGVTKVLPGFIDNPLHRLYRRYSPPTSVLRYDRNGRIARGTCGARNGLDCDEFPMASTYEGAAKAEYEPYSDPNAYSVRLVDPEQNRTAGGIAKLFYRYYRVLDPGYDANYHPQNWDAFYVEILS
ncbi:hypothetical protein [Kitasatospora sp. LaBMicrA B282]|uniref:hypothetical protein n=1 Tax=Kitasatospora sp. LaBMicrA B282 TaxID=3420949 RepID=UPI003D10B7E4